MFIAMYRFTVRPGFDEKFIHAWKKRTEGIYLVHGSLGSRLHKVKTGVYIGYAQWPSKELWQSVDSKIFEQDLYKVYEAAGEQMDDTLLDDETVFEMEVISDYLHTNPFNFK